MKKLYFTFIFALCFTFVNINTYAQSDAPASKSTNEGVVKKNNEKTTSEKVVKDKATTEKTVKTKGTFSGIPNLYSGKPFRSWSIDVMATINNAQADIKHSDWWGPFKPINENRIGASIGVTKMFSGAFGLNLNYRYGSVAGFVDNTMKYSEDQIYMTRDLGIDLNKGVYFKTNFHQVSTVVMWDISNTVWGLNRLLNPQAKNKPYKIRKVGFYGYSGLGMIWYKSEFKHLDTKLDVLQTDLASNDKFLVYDSKKYVTEWTVPVGLGMKVKCSKLIDLKLEANASFIFTDKLDGIIYDHPNRWKNDMISGASVGLTFKLGGKKNDRESINWINGLEYFNARFDKIEKKIDKVLTDNDKDGVSDVFDKETETPEGTMVDGSGKSMDIDRDGIVDAKDLEIFSPDATKVDEFGKTKDDDADGVVNGEDKEPNSARGARVDWQGVTIPEIAPEKPKAPIDNLVLTSIFFDYNKSNIKQEYYKELFKVVNFAKQNPNTKITIQGNADVRGGDDYNVKLGQSRAEAIIAYFAKYFNISASQFIIESKGEREPISKDNDLNRRVDFVVTQ